MKKYLTSYHTIRVTAVSFCCASSSWSINYEICDSITNTTTKISHQFDSNMTELTTPRDVFNKIIERYKSKLSITDINL
jgi:hypothetical protein